VKLPKHIPQLDVLRGVAVLNVMLYHVLDIVPRLHLKPIFGLGYAGVDLFFVLSGFLITGILVSSKDADNYFTNFYARRALRIWPLYYLLLLFTFVLLPAIQPALKASIFERSHPWQAFPFFLQNLTLARPPFDTVRVTWSLAIEEQFYLVWPVVVWLAPRRMLKPLALSGLFLSMALRWSVLIGLIPPLNIYMNTLTRLDGLSLGAFLALWIPEASNRTVKLAGFAAVLLTLPAAIAMGLIRPGHWSFYSLVAACFAGMLCIAIVTEALSNAAFLKYTGKVSYALYLVHVPVFSFVSFYGLGKLFFPHSPLAAEVALFVMSFALCYAFAAISWHFFESRFLRLKSRFEYAPVSAPAPSAPPLYAGAEEQTIDLQ
jgi:peptidoglycan/LPS O-acetylase OafA/YrhL